jgi:hypothetical protein
VFKRNSYLSAIEAFGKADGARMVPDNVPNLWPRHVGIDAMLAENILE